MVEQFPRPIPATQEEIAMNEFRIRAQHATLDGFAGGFPNFYFATYTGNNVGGTIYLKPGPLVEWRDVLLSELGNPGLDDFGARFRNTNEYATRNGFIGGFPNFFHADYGQGIVCGTMLIKAGGADWRDVPLSELGNNLNDIGARFRGTQDYAKRNGYVGGFPNMFHAERNGVVVCGTILVKPAIAEWRDVVISTNPR